MSMMCYQCEQTAKGELAISDSDRIVIDLTDGYHLIMSEEQNQVYVKLSVAKTADANAVMTSVDVFYDPEGDGIFDRHPSDRKTVSVAPGKSGCVTVVIGP